MKTKETVNSLMAYRLYNDLNYHKKHLENICRQHGIEGENVFYLIAFQYFNRGDLNKTKFPKHIKEKATNVLKKIKNNNDVMNLINSVIVDDKQGDLLPVWYQYFIGRRFRADSGKFFTPHYIASAMASLIPRKRNSIIIDPSCGSGTFLLEASKRNGTLPCSLVGNDVELSLVDLTESILNLSTQQNHRKIMMNVNIYEPNPEFKELYGKIDFILANPPFSMPISSTKTSSNLYSLGYRNSDAIFLDVCLDLLKSGGRLVCLLPHSIIANKEFSKLRSSVEQCWHLRGVISLPEGVFHMTANTTTRADIIILDKDGFDMQKETKAVFASVPSIGIPLNSRDVGGKDYLQKIVQDKKIRMMLGLETEC